MLGGNNSSEVRVWLQGARNKEPWPRVGDVVAELEQDAARPLRPGQHGRALRGREETRRGPRRAEHPPVPGASRQRRRDRRRHASAPSSRRRSTPAGGCASPAAGLPTAPATPRSARWRGRISRSSRKATWGRAISGTSASARTPTPSTPPRTSTRSRSRSRAVRGRST